VFRRRLLSFLVIATLASCDGEGREPVELRVGLDPDSADFGAVEVWGLPPSLRNALARVSPQDERWSAALAVHASPGEEQVPPLAGRYGIAARGCLRFTPKFAPDGPLSYRIRLDPAALARLAGSRPSRDTVRQWSFALPARPAPVSSTTVAGIYPSSPVVPANQLRWYVEFSAPMREGDAAGNVHLLDSRGREVDGSFLTVQQELWDPDRTRITLFFDMGRVKRAIRTRVESGPVLRPGRSYTLTIDSSWRDARGAPLVKGVTHQFRAGPEDHTPVRPERWTLRPPAIGSRGPVTLDFGEPLDHALASRLIAVTGPEGTSLPGDTELLNGDRQWRFTPDSPWLAGHYRLRIHPALEDLAGNRVGHVFDADLQKGEGAGVDGLGTTLEFAPMGESSARGAGRQRRVTGPGG
jgi:hypothetical protein